MDNLLAARWQMALSLGFHIMFAVAGIALPLMMVIAEWLWLKEGRPVHRILAQRWAKGAAILFAVGAVTGTVLSFELGLLWPGFMRVAGPVIGPAFGLEGFAFFTEAIFLGVYIYGWDRVSPRVHWLSGVLVAFSGMLSGVLVVAANAWMNTPAGFQMQGGLPTDIDPIRAIFTPALVSETVHMTLAAYAAGGFLVAGIHAWLLGQDRENPFHRAAIGIALGVGGVAAVAQPISGDFAAKVVARTQPVKLAAMEGQFQSEERAPLRIGGFPDTEARRTPFALEVPGMLSFLAFGNRSARVVGLNEFDPSLWPPVAVTHVSFQIMVLCGMIMSLVALWVGIGTWRRGRLPDGPVTRWALILAAPLGMIAVEAGWTVTEVGRQPWIIRGVLKTAEAITPVQNLWISLTSVVLIFVLLGVVVAKLLGRLFRSSPLSGELALLAGEKRS